MTSGTDRTAPLVLLRNWLLPITVAAAGVGVHYVLHVPPGPLPPPSPAELEAEKKARDKEKRDEELRQRAEDKKAGKTRPRSTVRELAYEPFKQPRSAHIIEQLWAYYEPMAFKKEPTFDAWQTAHKPLLWQLVEATRSTAQPDAPAIEVAHSECHTIRCQFTISSTTQEALTTEIAALEQLRLGSDPLWHSFDAEAPVADPPRAGAAATPPRFKAVITVSFTRDLPVLAEVTLPGKGPVLTPSPPATGPIPAGQRGTAGTVPGQRGTASTAPGKASATGASTSKTARTTKPAEPSPG